MVKNLGFLPALDGNDGNGRIERKSHSDESSDGHQLLKK